MTTTTTYDITGSPVPGGFLFTPPPSSLVGGKPGTLFLDKPLGTIIDEVIFTKSSITLLTSDLTARAANTLTILKTGNDTTYVPVATGPGKADPGWISQVGLTYHFTDVPGPEAGLALVVLGVSQLRRRRALK